MTTASKLGLRIKIENEEKDLDDIFLKITDYNANSSNYQAGEAIQLTQETGIKYIDENCVKRDLIERYIGYDNDGYIAANYETDLNRIDASNLNAIKDTNKNNLVNLFYQLGTKKKSNLNNVYTISMHNKSKKLDFQLRFHNDVLFGVYANQNYNIIELSYKLNSTVTSWSPLYKIENSTVSNASTTSPNLEISNFTQSSNFYNNIIFYLIKDSNVAKYLDISSGLDTKFFDKDTV